MTPAFYAECTCDVHTGTGPHRNWCATEQTQPTESTPAAEVRAALTQLNGTPESAVALLADVPIDQLGQYGGMPNDEPTTDHETEEQKS